MTRTEYDALSPREKDALVAEHVMGVEMGRFITDIRPFTSDIGAAWSVVDVFALEDCDDVSVAFEAGEGEWRTVIVGIEHEDFTFQAVAPSAPESICLAALIAKGVVTQ